MSQRNEIFLSSVELSPETLRLGRSGASTVGLGQPVLKRGLLFSGPLNALCLCLLCISQPRL